MGRVGTVLFLEGSGGFFLGGTLFFDGGALALLLQLEEWYGL
jgi:hypothetical protein